MINSLLSLQVSYIYFTLLDFYIELKFPLHSIDINYIKILVLFFSTAKVCFFLIGYGKSVCYQMPSLLDGSLTLVISPLISLMNDQLMNVRLENSFYFKTV